MTETLTTQAVEDALDALAAPLHAQLQTLDTMIEETTAEVYKLRSTRAKLKKALELINPAAVPAKKKEQLSQRDRGVAPATLTGIENWILERKEELNGNGGFSAPELFRDYGFGLCSDATLNKALGLLHNREVIRLDHRGSGGAKYYKVVG